jgi:uncharacterized peroxidase-related enzyme
MPRLRSLPEQPVMRDLYKSQPASCKPLGELTEVAMRGPSPFTQGQRELIAAYVSGLNACTYCHTTHAGVAAAFGVQPDLFNVLLSDIDLAPVEERIKPILRYARKLTLSPARMTDADAAAIYEAGWGDDALYSTVLVTALFNFYNRLVDGVGLALPEGYVAEAAKRLSTQGYDVFAKIAKALDSRSEPLHGAGGHLDLTKSAANDANVRSQAQTWRLNLAPAAAMLS